METENRHYRRSVVSWCMYDWANSAFATTIMAAVLPIYYSSVAASTLDPDPNKAASLATSYWGYTVAAAMLIVAVMAPVLGAIADYSGTKKRFMAAFWLPGVMFTSLLVFMSTGDWLLSSGLYILGNVGFAGANIFYDGLLPHVAKPKDIDVVSTAGYAFGYLGGGLLLAINVLMIQMPHLFGIPDAAMGSRLSFLSVGIWWLLWAIPTFLFVKEPPAAAGEGPRRNPVVAGFGRLINTFKELRLYKQLLLFILAFWIYNDGIGTIIKMATIYGAEIGIGQAHLIGALLMVQFIGIPFTFLFGWLAGKLGTKPSILLALGVYAIISVAGFFMTEAWHFWALAVLVGLVQGGSQALSRSLFGSMTPKSKSAEFFGFYNVSSKFAGIFGPFVFALVGQIMTGGRFGILSLIVFFIVGGGLLLFVNVDEGRRVAQEVG